MRSLPVIVVALLVGILGTILVLGFVGVVPIFGSRPNPAVTAGPGQILVPVSVTSVSAYTPVDREHLFNPRTMSVMQFAVDPDKLGVEPITDARDIIGRVLRRPKSAFTVFTEDDFLPKGTRAGISGAIPPGKRAIVVSADKISGVQGLLQGDRFDLLLSLPTGTRTSTVSNAVVSGNDLTAAAASGTVLVVNNGQVISGVTEREEEFFAPSGIIGTPHEKTKTIREISLAVDPDEVVMLTKALASNRELVAVVRSGRPDATESDVDIRIPQARNIVIDEGPAAPAAAPVHVIEEIRGTTRTNTVVSPSR